MARSIDTPHNTRSRRTRDALLTATRDILEAEGFEALTMGAAAERAGVSRRAVYLHFTSRAELVSALFEFIAKQEGLAGSQGPIWTAPDSVAALRQWVRHLVHYHPRLIPVDRAIERMRRVDPDAQAHRDIVSEAQMGSCRRIAQWLHDDGRLAEPWSVETAAEMLFALISTDMFERLTELRGWPPKRVEEHLWALHEATFVRPADSREETGCGR